MEFIIFSLYLIFIFLSIQIWFSWKHVDKKEGIFVGEPFFKRIWIYVFLFSISFMLHEFLEGTDLPGAVVFFEFFELLGFISIVLFTYEWYIILRKSARKKSLPPELTKIESGVDTNFKN